MLAVLGDAVTNVGGDQAMKSLLWQHEKTRHPIGVENCGKFLSWEVKCLDLHFSKIPLRLVWRKSRRKGRLKSRKTPPIKMSSNQGTWWNHPSLNMFCDFFPLQDCLLGSFIFHFTCITMLAGETYFHTRMGPWIFSVASFKRAQT